MACLEPWANVVSCFLHKTRKNSIIRFSFFHYKPSNTFYLSKMTIIKHALSALLTHCVQRGHSTTTWSKFYPILTNYPPRMDTCGHTTIYFSRVKRGLSTHHLPTLSCPRSYGMPPKRQTACGVTHFSEDSELRNSALLYQG